MTFPRARIGAVFDVFNGATPASGDERYWDGDIPWVTPADLGANGSRRISGGSRTITAEGYAACGTQMVPAGTIILSIRAPIGHLAIAERPMCFNQGCRGLRPTKWLQTDFAYWVLVATRPELEAAGQGSTFQELGRSRLRAETIPLPDLATQKAIAAFLDAETARIDALIEKKERFATLANERWRGALDSAIHGGEYVGLSSERGQSPRLPADWIVSPLKHLTDQFRPIMYGIVLPGPNVEEGVMIVKGGDVKPGRLDPERLCKTTLEIEAGYARSRLRAGDLVVAIRGGIGDVEIVPAAIEGANLTQDAARVAPRKGVCNRWLRFALTAPTVFAPLEAKATGAAVRGINIFDLKRVRIPTPPPEIQVAIADQLEVEAAKIGRLRKLVNTHAARLREFRAALITAAVTGQIDPADWRRRGESARRLDRIEAETAA